MIFCEFEYKQFKYFISASSVIIIIIIIIIRKAASADREIVASIGPLSAHLGEKKWKDHLYENDYSSVHVSFFFWFYMKICKIFITFIVNDLCKQRVRMKNNNKNEQNKDCSNPFEIFAFNLNITLLHNTTHSKFITI